MPEERNSGLKVKIFLATFLIFICVIFVVYTYHFISINKEYINEESKLSTDCFNINLEIISSKYSDNNLMLTVRNKPSSMYPLTRINIITQNETNSKKVHIAPSSQEEISFENLGIIQESILVYPENCEMYAKAVFIKKS